MSWHLWLVFVPAADAPAPVSRICEHARQEGLIVAGNPKAILTFAAFLPRFLDPAGDTLAQFTVMGMNTVALEAMAAAAYAFAGSLPSRPPSTSSSGAFNRACKLSGRPLGPAVGRLPGCGDDGVWDAPLARAVTSCSNGTH